jgi:acyl dehydratase
MKAVAEKTAQNGLAASGWHTAAVAIRLAIETRPFGRTLYSVLA